MPHTLFEKIWNDHLVGTRADGRELLYIDRHVLHELHAPHAFGKLEQAKRAVRRPDGGPFFNHAGLLFAPTEEVAQARKIIAAFERPENASRGAIQLDGRMVERLHAEMAKRTIAIADAIAAMGH